MEKTVFEIREVKQAIHSFYCDHCGIELGSVEEYEDGYYPTLGGFELNWRTPNGWYRLNKCLCDTCRDKYLSDIYSALENAGFKKH